MACLRQAPPSPTRDPSFEPPSGLGFNRSCCWSRTTRACCVIAGLREPGNKHVHGLAAAWRPEQAAIHPVKVQKERSLAKWTLSPASGPSRAQCGIGCQAPVAPPGHGSLLWWHAPQPPAAPVLPRAMPAARPAGPAMPRNAWRCQELVGGVGGSGFKAAVRALRLAEQPTLLPPPTVQSCTPLLSRCALAANRPPAAGCTCSICIAWAQGARACRVEGRKGDVLLLEEPVAGHGSQGSTSRV